MFQRLGRIVVQYRFLMIIVWIAIATLVTLIAPNIEDVASSDTADFLPNNAPFVHADRVYRETFPEDFAPSSMIIVVEDRRGILNEGAETFEEQTNTPAGAFIQETEVWLSSADAPPIIQRVTSPLDSPSTALLMIAPDNHVAIMRVEFSTSETEEVTTEALDEIEDWVQQNRPEGVKTYQTGEAPIVNNTTSSIRTSVDRTIWVTVALVIIMLLIVYRSPISPLIPLMAVTLAYLITRGIVAYIGDTLMTITSYTNVLLVVIIYGAGTDYCLFLISRFREEMADDSNIRHSTTHTVQRVGETISSSAGTIFVGFVAMIFAEMGIFKTSGPALAIGIVISLLAGLTLVPALLAALGDRAFWPGKATHRSTGKFYEFTSRQVSSYPLRTILIIVVLMLPFSIYAVQQPVSYSLMNDLPDDSPAVEGYHKLKEGLGEGNILPLTVVVTGRSPETLAKDIAQLSDDLMKLDGVGDVRSLSNPLGVKHEEYRNFLRVESQLRLVQAMSNEENIDLEQALAGLEDLKAYLEILQTRFPEIQDDASLNMLETLLANPLTLQSRRDELNEAIDGLAARFSTIEDAYLIPDTFASSDLLDQLVDTYLSPDRQAYKMEIILGQAPTSPESMDTVKAIRRILSRYQSSGDAVVSGGTTIDTDIRDTMNRDFVRAFGFVLLGIFLVLLLMLRSVVAPLYLIGTVLLSFTFTLGLTQFVFQNFFDSPGLTWYVPFFAFVFLVALGIDYSIFLFGRVKEEVAQHGIHEGVHIAVATTGAIITSAGIILAGTFAAMMAGEIMGLIEIGFAVSVGVLIDTFVVRTVLDPALATIFGRWTWFPGGVPRRTAETTPFYSQPLSD